MIKNNGYMIVRYSRYGFPDDTPSTIRKASGRRISTYPDSKTATSKFKDMVNEIKANDNLTILSKDLRSGWCIYAPKSGGKMMIAKMPYSSLKIAEIDL